MLSVRGDLTLTGLVCLECGFPLARLLRMRGLHFLCGAGEGVEPIIAGLNFAGVDVPPLEWLQVRLYVSPLTVSL